MQSIVEWAQIGIYFLDQITRQKTEPFTCLHRWTGQDDALHLVLFQRLNGTGNRKIGLTGSGRANTKTQVDNAPGWRRGL